MSHSCASKFHQHNTRQGRDLGGNIDQRVQSVNPCPACPCRARRMLGNFPPFMLVRFDLLLKHWYHRSQVAGVLFLLQIITPFSVYYNTQLIFRKMELWRLVTNFLYFGSLGGFFFPCNPTSKDKGDLCVGTQDP